MKPKYVLYEQTVRLIKTGELGTIIDDEGRTADGRKKLIFESDETFDEDGVNQLYFVFEEDIEPIDQ